MIVGRLGLGRGSARDSSLDLAATVGILQYAFLCNHTSSAQQQQQLFLGLVLTRIQPGASPHLNQKNLLCGASGSDELALSWARRLHAQSMRSALRSLTRLQPRLWAVPALARAVAADRTISSSADAMSDRLRCVMLNAARLDYDGRISFDKVSAIADVTRYEISDPSEVVSRVIGHEVVLNKEMPLTADLIKNFSPSVKLICEAGTGYNNIDLEACREKGIGVCNVPTYATEAMAHMSITLVMALSCSLVQQAGALKVGDRSYMKQCHLGALPHFELTGKYIGLIGGLGTIGLRVAAMAQALGLKVLASSTSSAPGMRDDGIEVLHRRRTHDVAAMLQHPGLVRFDSAYRWSRSTTS